MLVWQFSDPTGVLGSAVASVRVEKGQMRLRYAGQGDWDFGMERCVNVSVIPYSHWVHPVRSHDEK